MGCKHSPYFHQTLSTKTIRLLCIEKTNMLASSTRNFSIINYKVQVSNNSICQYTQTITCWKITILEIIFAPLNFKQPCIYSNHTKATTIYSIHWSYKFNYYLRNQGEWDNVTLFKRIWKIYWRKSTLRCCIYGNAFSLPKGLKI